MCLETENEIILKTFFVTKKFENMENFIKIVFPEFNQRIQSEIKIKNKNIDKTIYTELEDNFRKFLIKNYDTQIEEYIKKETNFVSVETMMDLILSQITITFSVRDKNDERINKEQYLDSIQILINEIKE